MIKVHINDPQPLPCPKCDDFCGYQYDDYMKIHYTSVHDSSGKYIGGAYSDGCNMINQGVTTYCVNCRHILPFKLIRKSKETVEKA